MTGVFCHSYMLHRGSSYSVFHVVGLHTCRSFSYLIVVGAMSASHV